MLSALQSLSNWGSTLAIPSSSFLVFWHQLCHLWAVWGSSGRLVHAVYKLNTVF